MTAILLAEEVYRRVLAVLPDTSRTTVYNTLRELVELEELLEVEATNDGGTRYDTNDLKPVDPPDVTACRITTQPTRTSTGMTACRPTHLVSDW